MSAHPIMEVIRQRFTESGLSQSALGRAMGTQQSHVSDLLRGTVQPTLPVLDRMATALGLRLVVVDAGDEPVRPAGAFTVKVTYDSRGKRSIAIEEAA